MFKITRIHVKNFRSIRECTFELKDLQLLIGPNNSGKSNLLRVFEFLRVVNDDKLISNVDIEKIRFQHKIIQGEKSPAQQFPDPVQITVELENKDLKEWGYYKIELYNVYGNSFTPINNASYNVFAGIRSTPLDQIDFVNLDLALISRLTKKYKVAAVGKNGTQTLLQDPIAKEIENSQNYSHVRNYTLQLIDGKAKFSDTSQSLGIFLGFYEENESLRRLKSQLRDLFQQLVIYKPDTFYIKLPVTQFSRQDTIDGQGSNIVAYLEGLLSSDPETFQQINKELNRCIPDFQGYNFATIEKLNEKGVAENVRALRLRDRFGVDHFAEDISEGTLYFLILFAIIKQKKLPPVLMLEEPETGIHPRRIAEIMEYIFKLREEYPELSIILTTHHPYVVDHFSELKDRVWVFDSEEGESKIRNLERDIIEPSNKRLKEEGDEPIDYSSSLGEHWAMGFLGGVPKPVTY